LDNDFFKLESTNEYETYASKCFSGIDSSAECSRVSIGGTAGAIKTFAAHSPIMPYV
jgi:hypothetical protein